MGSASYYPLEIVRLIERLNELRSEVRDADKWLWQLWLDGFNAEVCSWAKRHLDSLQKGLDGGVDAKSLRSPTGRQLSNRVRRAPDRDEFISAWRALAAGIGQLVSLFATAEPPIFDMMLKVTGLPSRMKPPDHNQRRELSNIDLSVEGLRKTLITNASNEDFEQARRDWRLIDGFIKASKTIDWTVATPSWEARIRSLAGAPADPPSVRDRKAQRVRPLPPPQFIILMRSLLHESIGRAVMLVALMAIRRSPYYSNVVSVALAGTGLWFDGLPRLQLASPEARAPEPRP
jgi:hypothetical protein